MGNALRTLRSDPSAVICSNDESVTLKWSGSVESSHHASTPILSSLLRYFQYISLALGLKGS